MLLERRQSNASNTPSAPIHLISGAHPPGEADLSARCRALARSWGSSAVEEQQHYRDHSPENPSSRRPQYPPLSPLSTCSGLPSPRFGNGPPTPEGSFVLDEIMEEPEDGTRTPVRHTGSQELGKRNSGTGASSYLSPPASALGEDESSEFGGRNSWGRYAGTSGGPLERMVNQEVESPVPAALKEGATTLEVSVWLDNGELLVGPDRASLSPDATLSSLYLEPLLKLLGPSEPFSAPSHHHRRRSAGSFPQINANAPFFLVLNLRTSPSMTFSFILHDLAPLLDAALLTTYCPNASLTTPGLITVLVSASTAPLDDIHHLSPRYVFVEAPIDRLGEWTADVAPIAAGPLKESTGWDGVRAATDDQLKAIREQVQAAHSKGMGLRYSHVPRPSSTFQRDGAGDAGEGGR